MKGFQFTFFSEQNQRRGGKRVDEWLKEIAESLGIRGLTVSAGVEGVGRSGRLHSAHFVELADQPIEITLVVSAEEADALVARLEAESANLFHVRIPVEFGVIGAGDAGAQG